jgi:hypothetical protein
MKRYNNLGERTIQSNEAVLGLPMTLLIILIISLIIFSMYALSSGRIVSFHHREQVKSLISNVCDTITTMEMYGGKESQVTMTITVPSTVEYIIFGSSHRSLSNCSFANTSVNRHCILYRLTDGYQELIQSPIAISNQHGHPLICSTGTYSISFRLTQVHNEVIAVGSVVGH